MVAARNSDSNCKYHDEHNRRHKDHNLISQTENNACQNANNGQLNYHCTSTATVPNYESNHHTSVPVPEGCLSGRTSGSVRSTRWTNELSRPPFERHPARVRDAVAIDSDRLAGCPDRLVPRSCEPGADEAGDRVRTDPIDKYQRFLGGTVRTAGEQL